MAHFAELNHLNYVTRVVVVNNNEILDENGKESEQKGIDFCVAHFGGRWIQTSYSGSFRKNFAGINSTYDEKNDAFFSPSPFPSWKLNKTTFRWEAPKPLPDLDNPYIWDEKTVSWVKVEVPDEDNAEA